VLSKTALLLVLLLGVAIQHGSVFVDNSKYHIVTIYPSNDLISKALSSDKFVVGFNSYSKGYIVLEFNTSGGNYILKYCVSKVLFNNPVKLDIYLKKGDRWVLLKRDVASVGWHTVPIMNCGKKVVIMLKSCGSVKQRPGVSFINYVKLEPTKKVSFVDINTMQFYISGNWYPLAVLVLVVLSCFFGSCLLATAVQLNTRQGLILAGSVSATLLFLTFEGVNAYLFYYLYPSAFSLVFSALVYGVTTAILASKFLNQFSNNPEH